MKSLVIKKITFIMLISTTMTLWNCKKADPLFVHDSNTISQMICSARHGASEFRGSIFEYDKNETLITGEFTQTQIEGGYGIILFEVPETLQEDVDLSKIYLKATTTWDQMITPSLSGRHDITGDGIIITVKSGVGTTRLYRIRGYYQ